MRKLKLYKCYFFECNVPVTCRAVKYFWRQIIRRCSALQGPFIVFASVHFEELRRQRHYSFCGKIIDHFDGLLICHAHNSPIRASFSSFTTIKTCRLIRFHVNTRLLRCMSSSAIFVSSGCYSAIKWEVRRRPTLIKIYRSPSRFNKLMSKWILEPI